MKRVGLALSGGGFRATLYHLGVVRYLRDAQVLPKITHITTVSGGSILGAHLVLNWDKYCGSEEEFDEVAGELIRFVQLDVRNRILRRFPLASTLNTIRRFCRLGVSRKLTRPGLLEQHYERFLYGDVGLSQLPDHPQLHILATNLSEGCLCSFNSEGLLTQRRVAGKRDTFEHVNLGLATVPMAVAASSAFPGFFPPMELTGWDVGADDGEFDRQAFTDGGVYDNLGLRMFRCIEESWVRDAAPLRKSDFLELEDASLALLSADTLPENTPLRRLRQLLDDHSANHSLVATEGKDEGSEQLRMIKGLWDIIRSESLFLDPSFQGISLSDPSAESLVNYVRTSNQLPEVSDRLWLNRQIIGEALKQVVGRTCLRNCRDGFDGIFVSDAGGKFKVAGDRRAGGLIKTALRSSDILMDRVWQLELQAFESTPGVVFFPIGSVVDPGQDPMAPHPEIQRRVARIRTDLDRFTDLEVSVLVQHGYCVARSVHRRGHLLECAVPSGPPWSPFPSSDEERPASAGPTDLSDDCQSLPTARKLRSSSRRRIWSTLFNSRDWPTYVWIPLLALIGLMLPYLVLQLSEKATQQRAVLSAIAEMNPVYRKLLELLEQEPMPSHKPTPFVEVDELQEADFTGYKIISDARIVDLRRWTGLNDTSTETFVHERIRIRRTKEGADNTHLRFQLNTRSKTQDLTCRPELLNPVLSRKQEEDGRYTWELELDFSEVPLESDVDVVVEGTAVPDLVEDADRTARIRFLIATDTGLAQIWMLMPEDRPYHSMSMSKYPVGQPQLAELVVPDTTVRLSLGSLVTFRFINPEPNFRYECRWRWAEDPVTVSSRNRASQ